MNKLKSVARSVSFSSKSSNSNSRSRGEKEKLEPVVGFELTLQDAANGTTNVPQLDVHLIGARHLPSNFGLKTVEGYIVKVKLFPGSAKFDSSIQTSSWPKFNETFRFPLAPQHKSSLKSKNRDDHRDINGNSTLPEKVFKGTFVVFTVIALLELPAGSQTGIKGTYKNFKRTGSLILRERAPKILANFTLNQQPREPTDKNKNVAKLTESEKQRNIGSVTFFLDPKKFEENTRMRTFSTQECWLPIRDITITPNARLSVTSSPRGQVEMLLELCDGSDSPTTDNYDRSLNPFEVDDEPPSASSSRTRFNFGDVKFPNMKRLIKSKREKHTNGLCLKVSTSKMRCSIKVKEEFENDASQIYVKTTVFEHDILSGSWRSEPFAPSLSTRWDQLDSTIVIPLPNEDSIENIGQHITIKTTIATKTKLGKKIVLGTIYIRPEHETSLQHWTSMITSRNTPVPMWYSFE